MFLQETWLGTCYCTLAGCPEHPGGVSTHAIQVQGVCKQWCSLDPLILMGSLRFRRAFAVLPISLCSFSLFCAGPVQLSLGFLSRGIALNIGVHLMCSWKRVRSTSSYTTILGLPPSFYFLNNVFRRADNFNCDKGQFFHIYIYI